MKGQLNNPAAMIVGGWPRTGDIAWVDPDGQSFICDRLKELNKINGFQLAPAGPETVLQTHPGAAG